MNSPAGTGGRLVVDTKCQCQNQGACVTAGGLSRRQVFIVYLSYRFDLYS